MRKNLLFKIELLTLFLMLIVISSVIIFYETEVTFGRALWTATLTAFAKTVAVQIHRVIFAHWHKKNGEKQEPIEPDDVVY